MRPSWPAYMRALPAAIASRLGDRALPHRVAWSYQVKLWSGNKDLHYECWLRPKLRVIELGLHFESDPLTNQRLLGAFTTRRRAIARAIPTARIEAWDRGWARVWEPLDLEPPGAAFGELVADRFASYVRVLEPILREEVPTDVAWDVPVRRKVREPTRKKTPVGG